MSTRWTLHVENFAKIKSADIEIAPFVGIVGENNTGKSYLMSLLWGLMTFPAIPFDIEMDTSCEPYRKCKNIVESHHEASFILSEEEKRVFIEYFNACLRINKSEILQTAFNYKVKADAIEIREYSSNVTYRVTFSLGKLTNSQGVKRDCDHFAGFRDASPGSFLALSRMLLLQGIGNVSWFSGAHFFPASRTGFMLTYPQLVGQSLEDNYSLATEPRTKTQLTLPYIRFLQFITSYKEAEDNNPDEPFADFVENELTHGRIMSTEAKMPVLTYRPDGSEKNLPLHVSSSVVTEVAPLLMAFRDKEKRGVYFIEEPEAHLHPELQKKMAQLLIRMSNGGKGVFITTHSDTIIQHINNMLMLGKTDSKDLMTKYGYKTEDLLKTENVKLYQFVHDEDGMSILMPLEKTDYGFVVPTFNDSLKNLLDETYAFQGE